jgi:hypothetical protein
VSQRRRQKRESGCDVGSEWRAKRESIEQERVEEEKNDENPWSLDLETESGETPENERTKETGLNREARLRKKKRKKRKERKKKN